MKRVVIVGASLAGVRAASALRKLGFAGELVLVGAEPHLPYDRPPLSKELLRGSWDRERIGLLKQGESLDLTLRLGEPATGLDLARRELALGGALLPFDGLVIATGVRARVLTRGGTLPGVHVLRTLEDAERLRGELATARSLVVLGAGFVGAEVASAARELGCAVTMIESQALPLASTLGAEPGRFFADLHRAHGVELELGVSVEGLEGGDRVERVRLCDGRAIEASLVVAGLGAVPNTEWLADSGVALDDGVCCDASCNVLDRAGLPIPGVVAAGDICRYESALFEERLRVEHWTHAAEQADKAARRLLGDASPFLNAPLFWSDQYGLRVQFAGRARPGDLVELVEGSYEERRFVVLYGRAGRLVGALAVRRPAQLMRYRRMIEARADFEASRESP